MPECGEAARVKLASVSSVASDTHASEHALYRFFDSAGALLYVGITFDPGSRWRKHRDGKPWWTEVARIDIETHPDRNAVLQAEEAAIRAEHPLHNVAHNRTRTIPPKTTLRAARIKAEDMPDLCHDYCQKAMHAEMDTLPIAEQWTDTPRVREIMAKSSTVYPYQWVNGVGYYLCRSGHAWTCTWGHNESGFAVGATGRAVKMQGSFTCPKCSKTFSRRGFGRRCPNCYVQLVVLGELFFWYDSYDNIVPTFVLGPYGWQDVTTTQPLKTYRERVVERGSAVRALRSRPSA